MRAFVRTRVLMHACEGAYVRVCVCVSVCMCVCARARGFCADAGARAGVRVGVRTCVRGRASTWVCMRVRMCQCVRARVRACVGEHACALQWAGSRTCGCACGRVYKLCRPLTYRHAN